MKYLKKYFPSFLKNQLIGGSFILLLGNSLASSGNYLYHLLMGRMLGPSDYGLLASLISFMYLFSIPTLALNLVVVKYVSDFRGKKNWEAIRPFYTWLNKKIVFLSLFCLLIILLFFNFLKGFLHLESDLPFIMVIAASLGGIFFTVNSSFLQGFLKFGLMSMVGVAQVIFKLAVSVTLVGLGLRVLGAIIAYPAGTLLAYLLSFFFVVRLLGKKKKKKAEINIKEITYYTVPVLFSTFAFTSLYSIDIVLARHFLNAQEAGYYAALATLGKIIFFASSPIVMALFPLVSERHANGKKHHHLFYLSMGLVFLSCLGISLIYFLFPNLMVKLLYGQQYLPASPFLWLFAIFLSFYSLSSLVINYCLSIKRVKAVILPILFCLLQVILIFFFHENIKQTVMMSIICTVLLFLSLLIYNAKEIKEA